MTNIYYLKRRKIQEKENQAFFIQLIINQCFRIIADYDIKKHTFIKEQEPGVLSLAMKTFTQNHH